MSTTQEFTAVNPDAEQQNEQEPEELLNVRETARVLQVHENTVRNLVSRGELRAIRLPGSGFKRFLKSDVDRMREEMFRAFEPQTPRRPEREAEPQRKLTSLDYRDDDVPDNED